MWAYENIFVSIHVVNHSFILKTAHDDRNIPVDFFS